MLRAPARPGNAQPALPASAPGPPSPLALLEPGASHTPPPLPRPTPVFSTVALDPQSGKGQPLSKLICAYDMVALDCNSGRVLCLPKLKYAFAMVALDRLSGRLFAFLAKVCLSMVGMNP